MKRLEGLVRKGLQLYNMIDEGDAIVVGLSGGKDSVALLTVLAQLRRYYERSFTLKAVTIDPYFGGVATDFSLIADYCKQLDVPYSIIKTDIGEIVFDIRKETNPCSLCAKMRRGALHDAVLALGCNKIALGHHLDDAIETFYMNLWAEGRIGCFSPVSYLSRKNIHMIRPMVLAIEADVVRAVKAQSLPIVKSVCPADGVTTRQDMKKFVTGMVQKDPAFRQKMLGALQKGDVDRWGVGVSS